MSRRRRTPGYIERRGDSYRITLCVDGKRHRFTMKTRSRAEAEHQARAVYDDLCAEAERGRCEVPTIPGDMLALIDRYEAKDLPARTPQTQGCYRISLAPLRVFFAKKDNPDVIDVAPSVITEYFNWRLNYHPTGKPGRRPKTPGDGQDAAINGGSGGKQSPRGVGIKPTQVSDDTPTKPPSTHQRAPRTKPVALRTVHKDLRVLRLVFERAAAERLLQAENPVKLELRRIRRPEKFRPIILSEEEYAALIRATADDPTLQFYVVVLAETGLRCDSEALHLRWEDIDLNRGFVHVVTGRSPDGVVQPLSGDNEHTTKNDESRLVPITPALHGAILSYRAHLSDRFEPQTGERTESWVFQHTLSTRGVKRGDRIVSFYKQFRAAARRAGLHQRLRQHDLRHRRVTTWLGAGHPAHIVMQAMGHKNLQTTMGYYQYIPEHMRPLQHASLQSLAAPIPQPTKRSPR